jgi:6-phosphogluconolactonase
MIQSYDEKRDIAIVDDPISFSCGLFLTIAKKAIAERGKFTVALSGGSTPKNLYMRLKEHKKDLEWNKVFVFFSDERSVEPDSEESNYHMAMTHGFFDLPIPKHHIFRMKAEKSIEKHAKAYEELICKHVIDQSFDLILLGMGDDGHTASLFPGTKALKERAALVVENLVPQKNTSRMTFTYPLIRKARHVVFLANGKGKSTMVKQVLTDTNNIYPSSRVVCDHHKVLWILDQESAKELNCT